MIGTEVKVDKYYIYAYLKEDGVGSMNVKLSRLDKNDFELNNIIGDELKLRWACSRLLDLCEQSGGQLASTVEV